MYSLLCTVRSIKHILEMNGYRLILNVIIKVPKTNDS